MIKKLFCLLIFSILLTGCSSETNFYDDISKSVVKACNNSIPEVEENNCSKTYYSYYLDKNIGKVSGDEISNRFIIDGNYAYLTLDISSIALDQIEINNTSSALRNIGSVADPVYKRTGRFFNSSSKIVEYQITISELEDGQKLIIIQTSEFIFVSCVSNATCENTIHDMMVLLRTCVVDEKQVVLDYSSENIKSSASNIITLFKDIIPESGYIIDYMDDWKEDTSFITIDRTVPEEEIPEDYSDSINPDDRYREDGY